MLQKQMLIGLLAAGLCVTAMAKTVKAPRGWTESSENGARVASNGIATVRINPWQPVQEESLEAWLKSMEMQPPTDGRIISSAGVIRETVPGAYSVIRKVAFGESQGHSVLYACPGQDGFARLMTLDVLDANFKDTLVGAMFGERVCKKEPHVVTADAAPVAMPEKTGTSDATLTPMPEPATNREQIAGAGAPPGLIELRGIIVMGIQPGGMFGTTDDFIALFEDGTYTSDLVNTFGDGVGASKRKKPRYWGYWRQQNAELQLRDSKKDAFKKTRGTWIIASSPANYRLTGCYGRLNTNSGADYNSGTTVGLAQTWCFWRDGRFTNSRTAFGSSSNASMRVASPKARGRYQIEGYVARFIYDDGHEVTAAFGYASEKGNHLLLNGKRFMGKKR